MAIDRPACSVSQAKPRVISKILSMNSSSLLRLSMVCNHQRISFCPPHNNNTTKTVALSMAKPRMLHKLPSPT